MDKSNLSSAQFWGVSSAVPQITMQMPDQGFTFIRSLVVRNPTQGTIDIFLDRGKSGVPDFTLTPQSLFTIPLQPCKAITLVAEDTTKTGNVYVFISSETLPGSQSIGSSANLGIGSGPGNPAATALQTIGAVNALMLAEDTNGGGVTLLKSDSISGQDGNLRAVAYGSNGQIYGNNFSDLQGRRLTSFGDGSRALLAWAVAQLISLDGKVRGLIGRAEVQAAPDGDNYNVLLATSGAVRFDIAAGTVANTSLKTVAGRLVRVLVIASGANAMTFTDDNNTGAGPVIGIIAANETVGTVIDFEMPATVGITAVGNAGNPRVAVSIH